MIMKAHLTLQILSCLSVASLFASPEKQAAAFYERGLAAEKRGELFTAVHLFTLATRAVPLHTAAQAKLKEFEERDEPLIQTMAKSAVIEKIRVHLWNGQHKQYREQVLNQFISEVSLQTSIPIVFQHFDGELLLNLTNTTFPALLDEIEKQTGLVGKYERHAVVFSPSHIPLSELERKENVKKVRASEGLVSKVEGGASPDSWVRIWFEESEIYLFCRPENLKRTFGEAIPADIFKSKQRLKFTGKIRNFNGRNWIELFDAKQLEILGSTPSSPLVNEKVEPVDPFALPLWQRKDGKSVEGEFIGLNGDSVVIKKNGKEFTVPFSLLNAASVEQAKGFAKEDELLAEGASDLSESAVPRPKHRWSFSGNLNDSLGGAHGTLIDPGEPTARFLDGKLDLSANRGEPSRAPTNDAYVDLPNGLVGGTNGKVTFETWVEPTKNRVRANIFRFEVAAVEGKGAHGEEQQAKPSEDFKSIFLIPLEESGNFIVRTQKVNRIFQADAGFGLKGEGEKHFVVTIDSEDVSAGPNGTMMLYLDGKLVASSRIFQGFLATFKDNNCWLGRAFAANPFFSGVYNEFRIYDRALSAAEVQASYQGGPDFSFSTPVWKNKDGRSVSGMFVGLEGELLVIKRDGKEISIPFSNLDEKSMSLAKRLSGAKPSDANKGEGVKGITIVTAYYGSQEQYDSGNERNVTIKAQQVLVDGKLDIQHTTKVFGDPHPYKQKILKITYLVDGKNSPSGKPYEFVGNSGEINKTGVIKLEAKEEPIPPRE
jgi:hypothetical protein